MLKAMKPMTGRWALVVVGCVTAGAMSQVFAEVQSNPYQGIVERNPFGLKPPPPPPDPTPVTPPTPPSKVILTGITTMFGTPRALVEITDQEAGKAASTRKPIMREGERDGAIEVLSIDVAKSVVKIRNTGVESELAFETPKQSASAAPPPGAPPGFPPPPLTTAVPNPIYPGTSPTNAFGRGSGVTVLGGGSTAAPNPLTPAWTAPPTPTTIPSPAASAYDKSGLRTIPSRSVRTDGKSYTPPLPR